MKRFLTAVLSVMIMFCGCILTACGGDVNLTYVALVNNSTGFTATDADTGRQYEDRMVNKLMEIIKEQAVTA